jgi:hypothetical protein
MPRQQLPPQIKRVEVLDRAGGKTVVRYRVKVDVGQNPETGRRQQAKRHCRTEAEARKLLSELQNEAATGTYVAITNNRVSAGGTTVENDPKSQASRRELPLPSAVEGTARREEAAGSRTARARRALRTRRVCRVQ